MDSYTSSGDPAALLCIPQVFPIPLTDKIFPLPGETFSPLYKISSRSRPIVILTRAQLSLGEADRTSRYLLLVYCLSPYACHYIWWFIYLSNPDPWENGTRSQRRYEKSQHSIKLSLPLDATNFSLIDAENCCR